MTTVKSGRKSHVDVKFDSDISDYNYSNRIFLRLVGKNKRFVNVDFKYTIFDTCYLRNCVFDSCDFTGCRFIGVNFYGSSFIGCNFNYATFEKTIIDNEILKVGCPGWENLKLRFARSLRTNFQQLGDSQSANKAIKVELDAMGIYLFKAWESNESYYRKKYQGLKRIGKFFEWLNFKTLGFVWGNGESTRRLIRTIIIVLLAMTIYDVFNFKDATNLRNYLDAFLLMPEVFIGVTSPEKYPKLYLTSIVFIRLVSFGFFMSIIIKRFNRR